jgi:osmotically-inducible protein OsmY
MWIKGAGGPRKAFADLDQCRPGWRGERVRRLSAKRRCGVISDLELQRDVLEELEFEPSVNAAHIGVTANKGVVTITGFVTSYAEKLAADCATRRVKRVKAIAEEIVVRLPSDTKHADNEIAARAIDILKWQVRVPADRITVKVERGIVTLTGEVEWRYQKTDAEHAVHKLTGVVYVINQIRIAAPVHTLEVKEKIQKALQRSAELEALGITVQTDGGKVILSGKVRAWYERELAEQAAWSAPGVTAVEDHLTVDPGLASINAA